MNTNIQVRDMRLHFHKFDSTSGIHKPPDVLSTFPKPKTPATSSPASRLSGEVAIFDMDDCGFITKWSNKAEQLFGFEYDDIVGKHVASLYTPGDLFYGKPVQELQAVDHRGGYVSYGWQQRKNGQKFWAYSETHPMKNAYGALIGYRKFVVETRATISS